MYAHSLNLHGDAHAELARRQKANNASHVEGTAARNLGFYRTIVEKNFKMVKEDGRSGQMEWLYHCICQFEAFLRIERSQLSEAAFKEGWSTRNKFATEFRTLAQGGEHKWRPHTGHEHEGDYLGFHHSDEPPLHKDNANAHPTLMHNTNPENLPASFKGRLLAEHGEDSHS